MKSRVNEFNKDGVGPTFGYLIKFLAKVKVNYFKVK